MTNRRIAVISSLGMLGALAGGCSTAASVDHEDSTRSALTLTPCPTSNLQTYQENASRITRALFGDASQVPDTLGCAALKTDLTLMRSAIAGLTSTLINTGATTVCGIPAVVYRLYTPLGALWTDFGVAADACFGAGTGAFAYTADSNAVNVYIDPSAVQLNGPLSGATGATAAGTYQDTWSSTSVYKWPSTYTGGTKPPAGAPCSPYDLDTGATATSEVYVNGYYAKCM